MSLCHCLACQKRTGAPFGIAAFFSRESVVIIGPYESYERLSDAGFLLIFHFCAKCGSTVFWEPSRMPDLIAVGVGAFADPSFPKPEKEVYVESRHRWVTPLRWDSD